MEKFKSISLTLLVAASLVQSYFLAYSTPKFDPINLTDYVQTELNGTQAELADILFPDQIVLHFGKKGHTVLPVTNQFYRMIFNDFLKQRRFDGVHRVNPAVLNMNWDDIRNEQMGFEIRFKEGIPLNVLLSIMQIKEDTPGANDLITRIWIYTKGNKEEVKTYFFTDSSAVVFEAAKADVSVENVEKFVGLGEYLPTYHSETGDYYLPDQPLSVMKVKAPFTQFTPEQLKRSLFVDPSMTRFLTERDGTQIYTDGKRGLQLRNEQRWFSYSDPVFAPVESRNDLKENLLASIQFINQHGGWNGNFMFNKVTPKQSTGIQTFVFQQYYDNYPVLSTKEAPYGLIKVMLQKGVVSSYERSLMIMDSKGLVKTEVTLPAGKELDDAVNSYSKKASLVSVFPAYQAVVSDSTVELIPRWAVELKDGTNEFLEF
jgi:regulatory protein YycH of two-component signal transduction system YycFG